MIQIGAYGGEDEARQHLNLAQTKLHTKFAAADPFTERVQKGDTTFYRARFAGFDTPSRQTSRSTTCTRTWTMCSIQTMVMPRARNSPIV